MSNKPSSKDIVIQEFLETGGLIESCEKLGREKLREVYDAVRHSSDYDPKMVKILEGLCV